jgi:hypothetical protein
LPATSAAAPPGERYGRRGEGNPEHGLKGLLSRNLEDLSPEQFSKIIKTMNANEYGQQIALAWIAREKQRAALNLPARRYCGGFTPSRVRHVTRARESMGVAGPALGRQENDMTTKAAFAPGEWTVVLEGPPTAGMIVITAAHGGTFRETFAMSKAYAEARAEHGDSELLDEIVSAKPKMDHTRYHSAEELRDSGLGHLRDAMALLESKATAEERDDYRHFVLTLTSKVAAAHREHGQEVSPAEAQAIEQITAALGATGS